MFGPVAVCALATTAVVLTGCGIGDFGGVFGDYDGDESLDPCGVPVKDLAACKDEKCVCFYVRKATSKFDANKCGEQPFNQLFDWVQSHHPDYGDSFRCDGEGGEKGSCSEAELEYCDGTESEEAYERCMCDVAQRCPKHASTVVEEKKVYCEDLDPCGVPVKTIAACEDETCVCYVVGEAHFKFEENTCGEQHFKQLFEEVKSHYPEYGDSFTCDGEDGEKGSCGEAELEYCDGTESEEAWQRCLCDVAQRCPKHAYTVVEEKKVYCEDLDPCGVPVKTIATCEDETCVCYVVGETNFKFEENTCGEQHFKQLFEEVKSHYPEYGDSFKCEGYKVAN